MPGDLVLANGADDAVGGDVPCNGCACVCLTAGAGYIRASYIERDEWAGGGGPTCDAEYTCDWKVDGEADFETTCTGGSSAGRHTGIPLTMPAPLGFP